MTEEQHTLLIIRGTIAGLPGSRPPGRGAGRCRCARWYCTTTTTASWRLALVGAELAAEAACAVGPI